MDKKIWILIGVLVLIIIGILIVQKVGDKKYYLEKKMDFNNSEINPIYCKDNPEECEKYCEENSGNMICEKFLSKGEVNE